MISQSPPFNNHFNISNNTIINNKCVYHNNSDITFLCSDCKLTPCCMHCISQVNHHRGHKIDLINDSAICSLINIFKDEVYPKILELMKNDQKTLKESNENFEKIEYEYKENMDNITSQFKNFYQTISLIEMGIKNNLSSTFNNNLKTNSIIKTSVKNNFEILTTIINENKTIERINNFNIDCDDENQTNELIKNYQQSLQLLNNNNNVQNNLIDYKNHLISYNKTKLEKVHNYFCSIFSIKEFDFNSFENFDYKNTIQSSNGLCSFSCSSNISFDNINNTQDFKNLQESNNSDCSQSDLKLNNEQNGDENKCSIDPIDPISSDKVPIEKTNNIDLKGVDCSVNQTNDLVENKNQLNSEQNELLHNLSNINSNDCNNSIDNDNNEEDKNFIQERKKTDSFNFINFINNQENNSNNGVDSFGICDLNASSSSVVTEYEEVNGLKYCYDKNNIKYVKYKNSKFYLQLEDQPIPSGVNQLRIAFGNNSCDLSKFNFDSTMAVMLLDGFDQTIEPKTFPDTVQGLYIYDIKKPLVVGSIPESIKSVVLNEGFSQDLTPGLIPKGVEILHLYNIKKPLIVGSIPSSVKNVILCDGFDHFLSPGIIPEGVERLFLYDIKKPLMSGSIPKTVKNITVFDGFKQSLESCDLSQYIIYANSN
ncbi:hypothetical protein RB653_009399 [Dictyostelium firmibasis]|uniref:B box-type domain-containing protein n=1 Tax=Dictyostelium firmibasis TaxID=79012 RepID=A0AAN7U1P8_9MYCE